MQGTCGLDFQVRIGNFLFDQCMFVSERNRKRVTRSQKYKIFRCEILCVVIRVIFGMERGGICLKLVRFALAYANLD